MKCDEPTRTVVYTNVENGNKVGNAVLSSLSYTCERETSISLSDARRRIVHNLRNASFSINPAESGLTLVWEDQRRGYGEGER